MKRAGGWALFASGFPVAAAAQPPVDGLSGLALVLGVVGLLMVRSTARQAAR